ncbi:MAG: efflux RND transporter periplasmic adaptor subunit [Vicinamibacteraceae bacterium]
MKKVVLLLVTVSVLAGVAWVVWGRSSDTGAAAAGSAALARPTLTVDLGETLRGPMSDIITVVGSLEGEASVEVSSKVNGRLEDVTVRIGDRVAKGALLAKVESREIQEQVNQAQASFEVARATVRQREADLKFAQTNLDRSRSLFERQLLPRQTLDDADARHQSSQAQLELSKAQFNQAQSRLDELKITLSATDIRSPVNGFVGKRLLDPGSFVSSNTTLLSMVQIDRVRLVANVVEKDLRRVRVGSTADVEVDAFPGEIFHGRVARLAPVLDPATRTAQMEVEVPNGDFRLKPGMYSRVRLIVATKPQALTVPVNAVVTIEGRRGVFQVKDSSVAGVAQEADFVPIQTGLEDGTRIEILGGLSDPARIVTTGAAALRDGDPVTIAARPSPSATGRPSSAAQ